MSETIHDILNRSHSEALFVEGDFPIDENVVAKFPQGSKILAAYQYGTSAWTITARLSVELPDSSKAQYFMKCASGDGGRTMMEGEFNGMSELYKTSPDFIPKPHSWGKYRVGNPDTYFFIQEFIEMDDQLPDPDQLCTKLVSLHRKSVSPTGKFGFHMTTCQGRIPQAVNSWESNWTTLFEKLLQNVINLDFETNGYWEELDALEKRILLHVIPKLIGNLERDGRSIKPCLIHGDLWEGNVGPSYESGNLYLFDSGAYYAHFEMEVGDWRCNYNKIHNKVYTRTYFRKNPPSEPREEWDDRNRMYCIYYNVIYSVNHKGQGKAVRQTAFDDMYYLIDKYAPFPEGEGPSRLAESERANLSAERDHTVTDVEGPSRVAESERAGLLAETDHNVTEGEGASRLTESERAQVVAAVAQVQQGAWALLGFSFIADIWSGLRRRLTNFVSHLVS